MDYNILTNDELINEKNQLEEEFNKCKEEVELIYEKMGFMSENYNKIVEILNRRTGVNYHKETEETNNE